MALNFVLDTNVVIYAQKGILAGPLPIGQYFASVITEIELLSFHGLTPEQKGVVLDLLREVTIVDISHQIKQKTIEYRSSYRIRVPDAIVVATAVAMDAELITNDVELRRLPGLRSRELRLITN